MKRKVLIGLVTFTLGSGGAAWSQQAEFRSAMAIESLASLEEAFWLCDYRAATTGNADIALCPKVYEALKQRRFDGDFGELLRWWQENKAIRHEEIAATEA